MLEICHKNDVTIVAMETVTIQYPAGFSDLSHVIPGQCTHAKFDV